MDIGVVGAGYVGLVTAACLAKLGHQVTCIEVDAGRVERLSRGDVPIHEPQLDGLVMDGLSERRLRFSTELTALRGCRLVIVAVGTLDQAGAWTDSVVRSAVLSIVADSESPRGVVIRSTLLPGTAVRLATELSAIDPTVELAVNPEFTREGAAVTDFLQPDRVVIGCSDPRARLVRDLQQVYGALGTDILVTDLTSAEMIKVASNVFLATKITFANELARLCEATGARVSDVVDGLGMDRRIGRAFLSPGPGYGGSCLPAQARALPDLAAAIGVDARMISAIDGSNDAQTTWVIDRATESLGRDWATARAAVLGMTFKAGTDDLRESPALRLASDLAARGATVAVYDPVAAERAAGWLADHGTSVVATSTALEACTGADVVFVATEWELFRQLDWHAVSAVMNGRTVVDARSVVNVAEARSAGLEVLGLRAPDSRPAIAGRPVEARIPVHHNGHGADDGLGDEVEATVPQLDAAYSAG